MFKIFMGHAQTAQRVLSHLCLMTLLALFFFFFGGGGGALEGVEGFSGF